MDYIDVQPVTVAVESDESFNKRVNEKLSEESDNENEKIIELIKQRDEIERQVNELDDMALIKYELKRLKRKVKDELKRL